VTLLFADNGVRHPRLPLSLSLPHKGGGNVVALTFAMI